ncbi:hypothetical protein IC232_31795, partial [Microvirga sp. BT688]|uniref:hypothetical protein n=1 Tax=Microvirga sp. TaxID=1873136 RepID=UPI0016829374
MYRLGSYLWRTLLDTSTPLWVTFAGVLLSAYGAYEIAPAINNELEKQKIKTEFVIRNLDNLNGKTQELLSEISIVNRKILAGEKNYGENIDKATRLSTELQWKAIELVDEIIQKSPTSAHLDVAQASGLGCS